MGAHVSKGEQTVVIIKPDDIQRGLVGAIISRFERSDFQLVKVTGTRLTRTLAESYFILFQCPPQQTLLRTTGGLFVGLHIRDPPTPGRQRSCARQRTYRCLESDR